MEQIGTPARPAGGDLKINGAEPSGSYYQVCDLQGVNKDPTTKIQLRYELTRLRASVRSLKLAETRSDVRMAVGIKCLLIQTKPQSGKTTRADE